MTQKTRQSSILSVKALVNLLFDVYTKLTQSCLKAAYLSVNK